MTDKHYGPTIPVSEWAHSTKYRGVGETFKEAMARVANALKDDEVHYKELYQILLNQRFLPAGRVQSAMGAPRTVTPYNCFVSGTIEDNSNSIMDKAKEAFETMRLGGGIGYDFSNIRPKGDLIRSLDSTSSGPVSFMKIYDAICATVSSAGHRRGAQMGVLRVDHPDIEEFVTAKAGTGTLKNFNISVGVTDKFMQAVKDRGSFDLTFEGKVYRTINAYNLWEKILRSTWDWAEPGVLFIDRMNQKNNLWYCETISATNPCGEQPLPPYGACLLGSINLVKYLYKVGDNWFFNSDLLKEDIPHIIRGMDNVVDRAVYPLPQQEKEAKDKRRMGIGVTGLANALEIMGLAYGTFEFKTFTAFIMETIRNEAYKASAQLAKEKGPFPLYDERLLESDFSKTLPESIRDSIRTYGLRNSHLLSVAPTGTISLTADNVSSGIEPVFSWSYTRKVNKASGTEDEEVWDYAYRVHGVKGVTSDQLTPKQHVDILNLVSQYVDSACSKTCNIGADVSWEEFKNVYMMAYDGGASGCTTFRASGKLGGILVASKDEEIVEEKAEEQLSLDFTEGGACYFDPTTGVRSCDE